MLPVRKKFTNISYIGKINIVLDVGSWTSIFLSLYICANSKQISQYLSQSLLIDSLLSIYISALGSCLRFFSLYVNTFFTGVLI